MLTYDISERARRAAIMSAVTQPQGNKTQPPGRKNVTLEKSSWRAAGQWYGAGEGNFSLGCVFLPGCSFVCDFTIQILYWILLLCTINPSSSMRATLPRRLVGRSVSTRERERERASSNPAVCAGACARTLHGASIIRFERKCTYYR